MNMPIQMTAPLYQFPAKAAYNKVIPKAKIYQQAKVGQKLKEKFVRQLDKIIWRYVLAPETINLPAKQGIAEIAVIELRLKTPELDDAVLYAIDKRVRIPIIYQLLYNQQIKTVVGYKRPSDADAKLWVVEAYFASEWQPENSPRFELPVALNLAALYEQLLQAVIPYPPRQGENLKEQVARIQSLCAQQQACKKLETRMNREKQFNRKVELNTELRELKQAIERLKA
ncbi:MAG: DUF4391 domain-containing protein [Gammaproteobacteria bacterium]|nr:DUF4391 domain-containing protein [Gammaproteobacteria bacterium]